MTFTLDLLLLVKFAW